MRAAGTVRWDCHQNHAVHAACLFPSLLCAQVTVQLMPGCLLRSCPHSSLRRSPPSQGGPFRPQQHKASKGQLIQPSGLVNPHGMAQILTGLLRIQHCKLTVSGVLCNNGSAEPA